MLSFLKYTHKESFMSIFKCVTLINSNKLCNAKKENKQKNKKKKNTKETKQKNTRT